MQNKKKQKKINWHSSFVTDIYIICCCTLFSYLTDVNETTLL